MGDLRERIERLCVALTTGLVERDSHVRLTLLSALTGEHALLLGPPGTAKSEIARRVKKAFDGEHYFERLLTRFTVPEELFGPLSLKALENDDYVRITDGYLPSATVAFLDEVFKANSAILNSLLGILNEREFDNGRRRVAVPLVALIGASNEIPTGEELRALYDRFLVRCVVEPVSAQGFEHLLTSASAAVSERTAHVYLTRDDLDELQREALDVRVGPGVLHLFGALRVWCAEKSIYVSDRRWMKLMRLLKTAAHTEGRRAVLLSDAWLLGACVWERPEQAAPVRAWLDEHIREHIRLEPARYLRMVKSFERLHDEIGSGLQQKRDACGNPLYLDDLGAEVTDGRARRPVNAPEGEPLYVAPQDTYRGYTVAELWRSHFSLTGTIDSLERHIKNPKNLFFADTERPWATEPIPNWRERLREQLPSIDSVATDLDCYARGLAVHVEEGRARAPLWIPPSDWQALLGVMESSVSQLAEAANRLRTVRERILKSTEEPLADVGT